MYRNDPNIIMNRHGQVFVNGTGGGSHGISNPNLQHQPSGSLSESSTLNDAYPNNYNHHTFSNNRSHSSLAKTSFLKVPLHDDRIEELLGGDIFSKPEKLYELKKLAQDHPTQWTSKSLINTLERLCDTAFYNYTSNDTVIILELHLRTFTAVLEALIQNPVILHHKLREKLYIQLTEFSSVHHNISVVMEQGLNKTWKGKLQHLNVSDVELQPGGVKRNYNIDFLLIHLRDTLHSLSDDETKFREGWRRFKDFFKGVLGVTPAAIGFLGAPNGLADNANILTTWGKMRDAFGFKVPVSSWYKDWRLLLMLKQTLDASFQEINDQNLKKFGERMILEYLWFHIKKITSTIVPSKDEDFEFSKVFNNKKRLFAELTGMEPISYPHTLWFGILDLAGSVCETSTKSITLSLCYYLALESLKHAPSTFVRFKAIELLLSLEHRRRDWFAVVDVDLEEYANRFEKKSKFFSLIDYVKYKLALNTQLKERIMNSRGVKIPPNLVDDFPAFTSNSNSNSVKSNPSILSLLAQELLCPVMLQITDQYYALECGHIISKGAFNIYKTFQGKKGKELTCSVCRTVIKEESLTLLPQFSTLNALSERLIDAGLMTHENANAIYDYDIVSNDTIMTEIKKPPTTMTDEISRHFTTLTNPPDPLLCARFCYKQNPQKALLILDKTLQNKANSPQALLERSKIYDYLQRYGEALYDVNKAIQYDNHNIEAYQLRAHLHFQMKNYKDSFNDISIFINRIESNKTEISEGDYKYTSDDLAAYELRGNICVKLGAFFSEGISDFTIVLENSETLNIKSLANRGSLSRELRKYKEALEDLTRVIQYNPNYMFAIAQRGSVYCKLGKFSEALSDLNEVLNNSTSEEEKLFAIAERGDLFCRQNKFYEALCDLDSVLEQDPDNSFSRSRRGYALFMLKKYDASLQDLNKVLSSDKTNYYSLMYRGIILFQQFHDYENSLKDFNAILNRYPDNLITIRQRAIVYFSMGKYEESLADFDKLINLDINDVNARCYRADILCELGRYRDSIEDCNIILQFDPSNLIALRIRGMALRKDGQYSKALIDLDKVLLQQPENTMTLHERSAVYTALHQYQRALSDCGMILYLKPQESISTFQERTKIYGELSEAIGVDEILIHLEQVLQDSPRNPLALTTRAYIYLLQWKCDLAVYDLNCALEYKPNYILSLYQRSVIYRITQDYNNALKDLERILEFDPGNNFAQTERNEIKSMEDFDRNQFRTTSPNHHNHQPLVSRSSESSFTSSISSVSISTSERSSMSRQKRSK